MGFMALRSGSRSRTWVKCLTHTGHEVMTVVATIILHSVEETELCATSAGMFESRIPRGPRIQNATQTDLFRFMNPLHLKK